MRTKILCISVLRVASVPRVKLASCVLVFTSSGEGRGNLGAFLTFSICACLVLSISSSSWCLGRAAVCDCGTPWTYLLPFFLNVCKMRSLESSII